MFRLSSLELGDVMQNAITSRKSSQIAAALGAVEQALIARHSESLQQLKMTGNRAMFLVAALDKCVCNAWLHRRSNNLLRNVSQTTARLESKCAGLAVQAEEQDIAAAQEILAEVCAFYSLSCL